MVENKTQPNDLSVDNFLNSIPDDQKRQDSITIVNLMREITGSDPRMWGDSIIGFNKIHYKYASGREGDWFGVGFSPRKQNLTIYLSYGLEDMVELRSRLGKHKIGKACLYINKIKDIDLNVLKELIQWAYDRNR